MKLLSVLLILFFGCLGIPSTQAQKKASRTTNDERLNYQIQRSREDVISAAEEYKESLTRLMVLIEEEIKEAERVVEKRKAHYQEGVIGYRELEESQKKLEAAKSKHEATKVQIIEADSLIHEIKYFESLDSGKPPYKKAILLQVLRLGALRMSEIISAVQQRGVGFRLTPEGEHEFRRAGASSGLINAIRAGYREDK